MPAAPARAEATLPRSTRSESRNCSEYAVSSGSTHGSITACSSARAASSAVPAAMPSTAASAIGTGPPTTGRQRTCCGSSRGTTPARHAVASAGDTSRDTNPSALIDAHARRSICPPVRERRNSRTILTRSGKHPVSVHRSATGCHSPCAAANSTAKYGPISHAEIRAARACPTSADALIRSVCQGRPQGRSLPVGRWRDASHIAWARQRAGGYGKASTCRLRHTGIHSLIS